MDRKEYVAWAKQRALALLEEGKIDDAVASILSDLKDREETRKQAEGMTLFGGMFARNGVAEARSFINGFN